MDIADFKKIPVDKVKQLDLIVLLGLLYKIGFNDKNIFFQSRLSLSQSGNLIDDIRFDDNSVLISLNMGILSSNSTVPDYILDFFSLHSDSISFNVFDALASKLLKNQINMLFLEKQDGFKNIYQEGNILFMKNDGFSYSLSSLNNLFERGLIVYKTNVRSKWKLDLMDKPNYLSKNTSFSNIHLGNKSIASKLCFDITIQSESLLTKLEYKNISKVIDDIILYKLINFKQMISVNVWLIVHPIKLIFTPFNLSKDTKLMNNKIKIYERHGDGY